MNRIIEGLDAQVISGGKKRLLLGVPNGKGKNAVQFLKTSFAPLFVGAQKNFGIGIAFIFAAKFTFKFKIIINLAVESNNKIFIAVPHWLVSALA